MEISRNPNYEIPAGRERWECRGGGDSRRSGCGIGRGRNVRMSGGSGARRRVGSKNERAVSGAVRGAARSRNRADGLRRASHRRLPLADGVRSPARGSRWAAQHHPLPLPTARGPPRSELQLPLFLLDPFLPFTKSEERLRRKLDL